LEVALLGPRGGRLVPGMPAVDRVADRVAVDVELLVLPVIVERRAEQDADIQIDVDQVMRHGLAVDDHAGRDVHRPAPPVPVAGGVGAALRVVERAPAAEQPPGAAHLLVARQGLVEKSKRSSWSGTTRFMNSTYFISRTM